MQELYDVTQARSLKPEIYPFPSGITPSMIPVPQDNTIATNDLRNAITLVSFHKGKLKTDHYFHDAYDQIRGGGTFLPVFSGDTIGFGQSRRFMLFNFRNRRHEHYRVAPSLEETIQRIAVADGPMRHFIFEIKEYDRNSTSHRDFNSKLMRLSLNDGEIRTVWEVPRKIGNVWSVVDDKIFLWRFRHNTLQVVNMMFEPAHHPLADVISRHKEKLSFVWIHSHPTLPFAVLAGGKYGSTVISWNADKVTNPLRLFSEAKQFSFSPDGKWLTFKKVLGMNSEATYLMPVSEKYPNYLGSPILLMDRSFQDRCANWTHNPTAFVATSRDELFRWELTREAYPEAGEMDLHDYIVRKDLENLTREKRQGLGQE